MKMNVFPHTVFLTVGPSNCGKSYFSEKLAEAIRAKSDGLFRTKLISSDNIRRELLNEPTAHKYDPRMMQVSDNAFQLLHTELEQYMRYPVSTEAIIVDTTGLSDDFRNKIINQAERNQYRVEMLLFAYDDREDYFKYATSLSAEGRAIIAKHVQRFRQEVLGALNRKAYNEIHKVTTLTQPEVELPLLDFYKKCLLQDDKYTVIGDIHGCVDELIELLVVNGFEVVNGRIVSGPNKVVLVGDPIDKGPKSKEVLQFMKINRDWLIWTACNHLYFVANFHNMESNGMSEEFRDKYFDSIKKYQDDPEFWELAKWCFEQSLPFLKSNRFMVTHASCENKFLGKLDRTSMKKMRNNYAPNPEEFETKDAWKAALESHMMYVYKEAVGNMPLHIFGHNAFQNAFSVRNKHLIDTGCAYGGKLTSVTVNPNGSTFYASVKSKQPDRTDTMLPRLFDPKEMQDVTSDLEGREWGRIRWSADTKLNFISGTVCPADKRDDQLEDLNSALEYFKANKIKKVVMQKKYMGSRCQLYVRPKIEDCMATSRNGYVVRPDRVNLTKIWEREIARFKSEFDKGATTVITDGELMPWSAMGKGLIERQYKFVEEGLRSEANWLLESGFFDQYERLTTAYSDTSFDKDSKTTKSEALHKSYGPKYETFAAVRDTEQINPKSVLEISEFSRQLGLFGAEGEVEFKGFCWLKTIWADGREKTCLDIDNVSAFQMVNDDGLGCFEIEVDDPQSWAAAQEVYNQWTEREDLEGAVLKPYWVNDNSAAQFIKVRNPRYLTIIYGADYREPGKYAKLLKKKSVRGKLRTSINEWNIGKELLKIKQSDISMDNKLYVNLIAKMIREEKHEQFIDPRL